MTDKKKHASSRGKIYVGCSGWAYASWKPEFYPADLPAKKLLNYYATRLNSVEVNYTFRSLLSPSTVQNWLEATGPGFRFSFKAPQRITHILRLKNCREALAQFANALSPVAEAGRIGVILFQLPPNMKADVDRLRSFLDEAGDLKLRIAFEFRHESWLCPEVYGVLRKAGAALCIAESDEFVTPEEHTVSFSCYRLRKSDYSDGDLKAIRFRLQAHTAEGEVFAYFKHEETPEGALRAVSVFEGLRGA